MHFQSQQETSTILQMNCSIIKINKTVNIIYRLRWFLLKKYFPYSKKGKNIFSTDLSPSKYVYCIKMTYIVWLGNVLRPER